MTNAQTTPLKRARSFLRGFVFLIIGHWSLVISQAHTASTAWLNLTVTNGAVRGQLELALRDLDDALGLDANDDGELTWGELRHRQGDLTAWLQRGLTIEIGTNALPYQVTDLQVSERIDTPCAVVRLDADRPTGNETLHLNYGLLFERDPLHRCLVAFNEGAPSILSPDQRTVSVPPGPATTRSLGVAQFIREGVHHIWTGYDHLAFLFALLLPAVLRRTPVGWRGAIGFRVVLGDVLKVVTAFTLAHSLTLGLAAFEVVQLPSRLVEATIAASIVAAVASSFVGWDTRKSDTSNSSRRAWLMAFGFGLIHGFGFAGVLGELGLSREHLAVPLFGFNAGVELGQLVCVLVFLPVAYALRDTRFYRRGALPFGSAAIALLAGGWFVERAFDVAFMPF